MANVLGLYLILCMCHPSSLLDLYCGGSGFPFLITYPRFHIMKVHESPETPFSMMFSRMRTGILDLILAALQLSPADLYGLHSAQRDRLR